jgi:hypothetical protein
VLVIDPVLNPAYRFKDQTRFGALLSLHDLNGSEAVMEPEATSKG